MKRHLKSLGLISGLFLSTLVLGGADGGCDIVIGDGDGDGDGDTGDGDGDTGDGDGDDSCTSDDDCGPNQACAIPDCAAICEIDPDDPNTCINDCATEGVCIDLTPGPCAAVDCAQGYHCEVITSCAFPGDEPEADCDPAQHPNCGGDPACFDEAVCVADNNGECWDDADCGDGFHCEYAYGGTEPAPCWDEDGDGQCDDGDALIAPEGRCVPNDPGQECWDDSDCAEGYFCEYSYDQPVPDCWDEDGDGQCDDGSTLIAPEGRCTPYYEPPACALIDCGPGYVCEEEVYCTGAVPPCDCDPNGEDCFCDDEDPDYQEECYVEPFCVPVGNDDCYDLDPEQCSDVPGCHLEEIYPPCAEPAPCFDEDGDGQCDDGDIPPPPNCEPILQCMPDYNPEGSCAGHCGEIGSNGQCFCDDACMQFGDCCEDYIEFCEEVVPSECASDADCGPNARCELREWCYDDLGMGEECFVEGQCVPVGPTDPCADLPIDLCEEVQGCHLEEILPPCLPGEMCEPIVMCVGDVTPPPAPPGCYDDAGQDLCGPGAQCVTETYCLDYCDQNVPDPECCFTESWCEPIEPPPPPQGCFGANGEPLCAADEECHEIYICDESVDCMDNGGQDCCFVEFQCLPVDPPPPPEGCIGPNGEIICADGEHCEEVMTCDGNCMDQNDPNCCFVDAICVPDQPDAPTCVKVETAATNPQTGNCVVFPTPCDVPDTWQLGC